MSALSYAAAAAKMIAIDKHTHRESLVQHFPSREEMTKQRASLYNKAVKRYMNTAIHQSKRNKRELLELARKARENHMERVGEDIFYKCEKYMLENNMDQGRVPKISGMIIEYIFEDNDWTANYSEVFANINDFFIKANQILDQDGYNASEDSTIRELLQDK